jgi:hypothetical protein
MAQKHGYADLLSIDPILIKYQKSVLLKHFLLEAFWLFVPLGPRHQYALKKFVKLLVLFENVLKIC